MRSLTTVTDLQKFDLDDSATHFKMVYNFLLRFEPSRELSLVKTNLEQAEMWLQEHIIRHGSGKSKN